ncbi:MAG: hypothetical protein QM483_04260 [Desulfuromusa sp.]
MFVFIVLLIVAGACFYFYQRLAALEQEIRAEQARAKATAVTPEPQKSTKEDSSSAILDQVKPAPAPVQKVLVAMSKETSLEESIIAAVTKTSGIKQTELYKLFAEADKKQLQKLVKRMADNGLLKREKQGSSFLLYPT